MPIKYLKSTGYVVDTLESAIYIILHTSNFRDVIINAIDLGGDIDTIGVIVGSLARIIYNLEEVPSKWIDKTKRLITFKSYHNNTQVQ